MPSWSAYKSELDNLAPERKGALIAAESVRLLREIAQKRKCSTLFYASGFLQKPHLPVHTAINPEDINGFMSGLFAGKDSSQEPEEKEPEKKLLLILHTPGGSVEAA